MTVVAVSAVAKWIAGVYSDPFLVRNSGTTTVYLGQDSSLSVATRAITLEPGASLNWQGKTELWAITNAGQSGELEWLYDADTTVTPGPKTVGIDGTVDAEIINEVVVVQNNNLIELANISSPFGNNFFLVTNINMQDYASVRLQAGGFSTPLENNFDVFIIRVQWLNNTGNVIFTDESVAFMGTLTTWVFPVKTRFMSIQFVGYNAAGALSAVALDQIRLWGSYHILQESYFSQNANEMIILPTVTNDSWVGSSNLKQIAWQFTQAPGTNRLKLPSIMGEMQCLVTWSIGTSNVNTRAVLTAHTPSAYGFAAQSLDVSRISNPTILQTYEIPTRMNGRIPLSILFANGSAADYRINMSLAHTGPQT